jgi:hypothetical protein
MKIKHVKDEISMVSDENRFQLSFLERNEDHKRHYLDIPALQLHSRSFSSSVDQMNLLQQVGK